MATVAIALLALLVIVALGIVAIRSSSFGGNTILPTEAAAPAPQPERPAAG